MNIEIANRLVNLRKSNNLSQEALAAKLGISRQAVSKWERAEASPDTDNLILLARLYKVSLDELLRTEDEIPLPEEEDKEETAVAVPALEEEVPAAQADPVQGALGESSPGGEENKEYVHVGFQGIHVKDKDGEVHVGWDGIHVDNSQKGENVHIGKSGVWINGERYDEKWRTEFGHFPMGWLIVAAYLVIGFAFNAWHPGWLLFFLIPIWYSLAAAIRKRNAACFAYPVLVTLVYLCLGIFGFAWHPGWLLFLTIPLYYPFASYINSLMRRQEEQEGGETDEEG